MTKPGNRRTPKPKKPPSRSSGAVAVDDQTKTRQTLKGITEEKLIEASAAQERPTTRTKNSGFGATAPDAPPHTLVIPTGTVVYTPRTRFATITPAIDRMFGFAFGALGGLEQFTRFQAFRPNGTPYKAEEWPFVRTMLTGEHVRDEEMHIVIENGSLASILVSSHRASSFSGEIIIIVMKDITGQKALLEALERSRQDTHDLLDSSPSLGLVLDADGIILACNEASIAHRGMKRSELVGRSVYSLHTEELATTLKRRHQEAIRTKKSLRFEVERDGRFFESTAYPIVGEDGQVKRLIIHAYDITDRRQLELDLRKSHREMDLRIQSRTEELQKAYEKLLDETKQRERIEKQLIQAQKMEAVGVLAGGIAHDFNNMLAVILGNAELALEDLSETNDNGKAVRHNVEQIIKASKRSADLVRQILTFSRKGGSRQKEIVRLTPLLKETARLLQTTLSAGISIRLNISTESDAVLADPSQIQQILMNLSTNAAYAMREDGGTLTFSLSKISIAPGDPILTNGMTQGPYVKLTVSDTGPGIPKEISDKIFDPFFTTKKAGEGTGMGLATAYGIVRNQGGAINVESEPGKGATFNVFLPNKRKKATEEPDGRHPLPRGHEKILIVDDEPLIVEMVSQTLITLGYLVATAENGAEGMREFERDHFDLVITDHVMPVMAGMRFAEELLKKRKDLPIILFTGYSETISPEKAKRAGVSRFLMKPVVKRELAESVRDALDRR